MPLAPHLALGGRWTLVGGKGGVGKTTVAAAMAVELADAGETIMVLSTDPAHSLGDAFGMELGPEPRPIETLPGVHALEIDPEYERERFLARHGTAVAALLERGTYLDAADVTELTGLTIPGMDEMASLLRLREIAQTGPERVVIDTAPTGHTLRLLELPRIALSWIEVLEAMEAKHAAVASALAGYAEDDTSRFVADLREDIQKVDEFLRDPTATRVILVTTAEPVVVAETLRYEEELGRLGIALGGVVLNRQVGRPRIPPVGKQVVYLPLVLDRIEGIAGLREFAASARLDPQDVTAALDSSAGERRVMVGGRFTPPRDRRLYFVGGKGGVGKTTVASALAVHLARDTAGAVLLLSVDPAGSLGEVLGIPVGPKPTHVPGTDRLLAQQLDAEAAWADFRAHYRDEVERLFAGLMGGGLEANLDREVVERLVDLAPPGVDELMALMEVLDSLERGEWQALVLDAAPTGHFLRLLEMPDLALDWSHTLLRLLLKYREVTGLGELAERVLALARALKSLRSLLSDESGVWVGVVALPESLSVPETARLLPRLRGLGLRPGALLVNRALDSDGEVRTQATLTVNRLLGIDPGLPAAAAPLLEKGPLGAAELAEFGDSWREIRRKPDSPPGDHSAPPGGHPAPPGGHPARPGRPPAPPGRLSGESRNPGERRVEPLDSGFRRNDDEDGEGQ